MTDPTIVTVTLNPALDMTVRLDSLVPGEVNLARDGHLRPAGKGVNVAMVLRDLGLPVSVTGILGRDNSAAYQALFKQMSMVNHFLEEPGATRINVKLSEQDGRVTDINLPGLSVSGATWEQLRATLVALCDHADTFVLSGSLPRGLATDSYAQLIRLLKERGKRVLVDTSGPALEAAVDAGPDLIKPNLDELVQWAGRPLPEAIDRDQAVAEIMARGVRCVVLSEGRRGLCWYDDRGAWQVSPPSVEVVSTVGAGDSLLAGIAYGLALGLPQDELLRLATAVAAMAVNQIGVGITDWRQLEQFKQQVSLTPKAFSR
ncbi:1-phosphofructokinase [Mangrovitalea sediminis]|uniref:1-phosphofructokinase n=1 Tax=Mangrovitalea sediminis TaxID=1982043 RepID=UPI001303FC2F|nr:1-phosphofructokinase [Mangrovitalea sediminis]